MEETPFTIYKEKFYREVLKYHTFILKYYLLQILFCESLNFYFTSQGPNLWPFWLYFSKYVTTFQSPAQNVALQNGLCATEVSVTLLILFVL